MTETAAATAGDAVECLDGAAVSYDAMGPAGEMLRTDLKALQNRLRERGDGAGFPVVLLSSVHRDEASGEIGSAFRLCKPMQQDALAGILARGVR